MKGNSITMIIGRVGNDAEVKDISGRDLITFSLAEDDSYKDKNGQKVDRVVWHKCQIWRKGGTASKFASYITKSKLIHVTGKARASAYQNKEGEAVAVNDFIVEELKFLGGGQQGQQTAPTTQGEPSPGNKEDDLPF